MSVIYRWLWVMGPGNPIAVRIVAAGSRRLGHFWIRTGYLGVLIALMGIGLLGAASASQGASLTELAKSGTQVFAIVAYGQVALICLLAPLFVAGAISEEQSGETIDILRTTPMSNLQIVLGSLIGRLFFVLALLLSGLPLFAVLLLFGGVPTGAVFTAFAVAGLSAFFVGAAAIALAVTRIGGRRAVFAFVIVIVGYLLLVYAADRVVRVARGLTSGPGAVAMVDEGFDAGDGFGGEGGDVNGSGVGAVYVPAPGEAGAGVDGEGEGEGEGAGGSASAGGARGGETTFLTPLHPLLVLEASINNANYRPPSPDELIGQPWVVRAYLGSPLGSFAAISGFGGLLLILFSATQMRRAGGPDRGILRTIRRWLHLPAAGAERRRPARTVGVNPVAWVEAHTRGAQLGSIVARGSFLLLAIVGAVFLIVGRHVGYGNIGLPAIRDTSGLVVPDDVIFRTGLLMLLLIEMAIITVVAIYMSGSSISKEREDGTLDLLLTTPITPRMYIWGKIRGLVRFLGAMLAAPVFTLAAASVYTLVGLGLGWPQAEGTYVVLEQSGGYYGTSSPQAVTGPLILPESAVWMPIIYVPYIAMCAAIGMQFSVWSRGVIGAIAPTLAILGGMAAVLGVCGFGASENIPLIGPVINGLSPVTCMMMLLNPWERVAEFSGQTGEAIGRTSLGLSAGVAALVYSLVIYALVAGMVSRFDHTVRRLSG